MRDPDLVQRAERAAMALERAWGHWRVMHGLGTDPLPPVSSYVGYSLEEPWGQPRVVFGVGAEEAERLAALLAGHDCFGPVHAEVSARPDWRLAASGGQVGAQGRPFDGAVSVPAQAPPPGAEPAEREAWHVTAPADAEDVDSGTTGVGRYQAAPTAMDSAVAGGYRADQDEAEPPRSPASPVPAEPESALPASAVLGPDALDPLPADPHEPRWLSGLPDDGDPGESEPDPDAPYSDQRGEVGRPGSIPPPAEFWQLGEPAGTVELAAVEQGDVIAFRLRPGQPADQWQEQAPAAADTSDSDDAMPSQGPGYCGPRYQGVPPQYQPGPGQPDPPALFGVRLQEAGEPAGSDQPTGHAGAGQPEVVQRRADQPEAEQSGSEPPASSQHSASQNRASRAKTAQSEGGQPEVQSTTGPSTAARSTAARSKNGQSTTGPSTTGPSTTGRSKTGQSTVGRSKTVQSKTAHSRSVQSGGQPKAAQPRAVQSTDGQSRPASPGRASSREAGKRPRG
jgi:hypothetical protein